MERSNRMGSVMGLLTAAVVWTGLSLAGCSAESKQGPTEDAQGGSSCCPTGMDQTQQGHEGQHAAKGPHGGHVIQLGESPYRAELLHDEPSHKVTVYLFDAETKEPVASDLKEVTLRIFDGEQFVSHRLEAVVGDAGEADPTRFTSDDQKLSEALLATEEVQGRLTVTVNGNPVTGIIEHYVHDHAPGDHDAADEHDPGPGVDVPDKDE